MLKQKEIKQAIGILKSGGVGILPTDTLYGLVGSAFSKKAVERIYKLKNRNPKKPCIILISSLADLSLFDIKIEFRSDLNRVLTRVWPGQVSVVLPCPVRDYLHRGMRSLAFRLPKPQWLRDFLKQSGPLVAPSANPEGEKPAETIEQAKKYFGKQVDFYVDKGKLSGEPSTLIKVVNNEIIVLRDGAIKI